MKCVLMLMQLPRGLAFSVNQPVVVIFVKYPCMPAGPLGKKAAQGKEQPEEEHTGITDDEDDKDDEGEPDYEWMSRNTLKASSEALIEVSVPPRVLCQEILLSVSSLGATPHLCKQDTPAMHAL